MTAHVTEQPHQQPTEPTFAPLYQQGTPDSNVASGRKRKASSGASRNGRACVPCRVRKCKCGGAPPTPCPNCIKDEYPCRWPSEDGRSSLARKRRSRSQKVLALPNDTEVSGSYEAELDEGLSTREDSAERHNTSLKRMDTSQMAAPIPSIDWSSGQDWLDLLCLDDGSPSRRSNSSLPLPSLNRNPTSPQFTGHNTTTNAIEFSNNNLAPFDDWSTAFGSPTFINAISARLPTIEEGSLAGEGDNTSPSFFDFASVGEDTSVDRGSEVAKNPNPSKGKQVDSKIVKVTWWRPHGPTAIAPGLKRLTLKVRVETPMSQQYPSPSPFLLFEQPIPTLGQDGLPPVTLMHHLIDIFIRHFGCQFPSLEKDTLERDLQDGTGSVFLFNCIAATAARFSTHPSLTSQETSPHQYGNVYHKAAKDLLGSMLGVPSRKTVMALVLLAHLGFAVDSESEEWMMTGMAVRMALDLGLHLNSSNDIPPDERRLDRLAFWSTFLLDTALSFGTGRETTFRFSSIKQPLPTEADVHSTPSQTRSPFPYAVKQMMAYGPLINSLNGDRDEDAEDVEEKERASWFGAAIAGYNELPGDMQWNVTNLQSYSRCQQAPIYLHLHLWMHTIIASRYLTNTDYLRRSNLCVLTRPGSEMVTPNAQAATNLWRNSARTIGDILVLSDVVNPWSYLALPFVNQAFFVAGCCFVKEVEQQQQKMTSSSRSSQMEGSRATSHQQAELLRTLLRSVASTNISTLQQGLTKQTTYWSGVAWVAEALRQRLEGTSAGDIDLVGGLEKLGSWVAVGDRGVVDDEERGPKRDV